MVIHLLAQATKPAHVTHRTGQKPLGSCRGSSPFRMGSLEAWPSSCKPEEETYGLRCSRQMLEERTDVEWQALLLPSVPPANEAMTLTPPPPTLGVPGGLDEPPSATSFLLRPSLCRQQPLQPHRAPKLEGGTKCQHVYSMQAPFPAESGYISSLTLLPRA